jgi:DMSO/TMAO reductase YedYZ molybdopterin-dependent catalytic subunit
MHPFGRKWGRERSGSSLPIESEPALRPRWIPAIVSIEDALQDDVLLADRLDNEPLSLSYGAPLRVISP